MIEEAAPDQLDALWEFFQADVYPQLEPLVRSILADHNAVGSLNKSRTDDLHLKAPL